MNVKRTAILVACLATLVAPMWANAQTMLMGTHDGAAASPPPAPLPSSQSVENNPFVKFVHDVNTLPDFTNAQREQLGRSLMGMAAMGKSTGGDAQKTAIVHQFESQIWGSLTPNEQTELKAKDATLFPPS